MTTSKSVSWSALINIGNNESLALTVSGEAANPDEARDIFAFACGQLLGVANSADETTAPLIRAYVSRLVQTEEARPVEREAPAPVPKKGTWVPKITKSSYDAMQADKAAKQDAAPAPRPSAEEQAAAAVRTCIKPPADAGDIARQQHADKLKADLERLQADHDARVTQRAGTAPEPTPAAPPEPEASVPAETSSAPPMPKPAPAEDVCEICGAPVTKSQAKLSQLFVSKTMCKSCMDQSQGGAQ